MERLHMQGAGQIGELVPHRERSATQRILGNNLAPCALRLAPCALRPAPRDQDGIAARLRMKLSTATNLAEGVGPEFSLDGMLKARQKTRQAIRAIAAVVQSGMLEEDAVAMAKQILARLDMELSWHPTRVRFGVNTSKAMKQESDAGVILQKEDIFFVDIAPRYESWEGDGGATFVVGHNDEHIRCAQDAENLFHAVREVWLNSQLSGEALYKYANQKAKSMGWVLNFDLPGHRISDFPHAAIHTGSLADFDDTPSDMRWILEIHIRHPNKPFGAFFEDMLLNDEDYRNL